MCLKLRDWLEPVVRQYGIALTGFVFASVIYVDQRDMMRENLNAQLEMSQSISRHTAVLQAIDARIYHIEEKIK